ncbi:hypothetical protein AB1E18_017697 [Capra hircus]
MLSSLPTPQAASPPSSLPIPKATQEPLSDSSGHLGNTVSHESSVLSSLQHSSLVQCIDISRLSSGYAGDEENSEVSLPGSHQIVRLSRRLHTQAGGAQNSQVCAIYSPKQLKRRLARQAKTTKQSGREYPEPARVAAPPPAFASRRPCRGRGRHARSRAGGRAIRRALLHPSGRARHCSAGRRRDSAPATLPGDPSRPRSLATGPKSYLPRGDCSALAANFSISGPGIRWREEKEKRLP